MKNKESIVLKILGIVFIITGLLSVILLIQTSSAIKTVPWQLYWLIGSALFLIAGFGILSLKQWARILALVLVCIKTIQVSVGTARDTRILIENSADSLVIYSGIGMTLLACVIGFGIIYYLTRTKVKEQFR